MKKQDQPSISILDIKEIEKNLPPKKKRSHHAVVQVKHLSKEFKLGDSRAEILKDIDLNFYSGEFAIVFGPSGCGKSTFLHTILGLEFPSEGQVFLREHNLYELTPNERINLRREKIGMVFQQSNWIKSLNVWENVAYPLWLSGLGKEQTFDRAMAVLEELEMKKFAFQSPMELSGGQQQRVALSRALSTDPWIIIADEPTGNLDSKSSSEIVSILARLNREKRRMILMVTHQMEFLPIGTRRVGMKDGQIFFDEHD